MSHQMAPYLNEWALQNEWAAMSPVAPTTVAIRPVKAATDVVNGMFSFGIHHKSH